MSHMPATAGSRWKLSNKKRRGSFAKKHRTTVFKPFKIQELMIDAVLQPGAELRAVRSFLDDLSERISGTGKSN